MGSGAFELYTEGDTLYQAMLESIVAAGSTIRLESDIFADDVIGRICERLEARAEAGVEVRLQLDAAGMRACRTQHCFSPECVSTNISRVCCTLKQQWWTAVGQRPAPPIWIT
jgi:phosphatidylserine/phosphatidylglycerophosphate/cardiolipin synthase-like enzyme